MERVFELENGGYVDMIVFIVGGKLVCGKGRISQHYWGFSRQSWLGGIDLTVWSSGTTMLGAAPGNVLGIQVQTLLSWPFELSPQQHKKIFFIGIEEG